MRTSPALSLMVVLLMLPCSAVNAQTSFTATAGINFSGTTGGEAFKNYDHDYGWKGGATGAIPLHNHYFFCPGLFYSTKSYKYHFTGSVVVNQSEEVAYYYERLILGYAEAPFCIERRFQSGFHADGGLFLGWQLLQRQNETVKYEVDINSVLTDVTSSNVNKEITADPFQAGIQLGIGYEKSGFDLSLTSQYHLTPLMNFTTDDPGKLHFLNVSLSLGYRFGFRTEFNEAAK